MADKPKHTIGYKQNTKRDLTFTYTDNVFERNDIEQLIKNGCLMRIADSLEALAASSRHNNAVDILTQLNAIETRHNKKIQTLTTKISHLKGRVRKLESK